MRDGILSPALPSTGPAPSQPHSPVDLRPLTTSELIDRGFILYRTHFTGFLLLALLGQIAPLLSQIAVTASGLNPSQNEVLDQPWQAVEKVGLIMGISLLAQVVAFAFEVVATFFIGDAYLGKIPSVGDSLKKLSLCFGRSIWTCLLSRLVIGLTFIFPALAMTAAYLYALYYPPVEFLSLLVFGGLALILFVLSMAPVLVVFMRLMVTVPALALEGLGGWKAIQRSSTLVRFDPGLGIFYWGEMRLSFLLLPLFIIELLILSLTSLPLVLFQVSESIRHGATGQIATPPDSTLILSQILTYLAGSVIWSLYPIATTLFYYDVRIRREGYDLEIMAQNLEQKP